MVKYAYMLQGGYGHGGATIAMFRRCDEFINQGITCISLTVDFYPEVYEYIEKARHTGLIPNKLECRNPFIDLAKEADNWLDKIGIHAAGCYPMTYIDGDSVTYYKTDGEKINHTKRDIKDRLSYFEYKGQIVSEIFRVNDLKVEYNYSPKGMCICIKEYDFQSSKQLKCLVFDYNLGIVKQWKSSYHWNVEWMKEVLPLNEPTVLICDGPGSARKILDINRDNVKTIHVLHNNHKHANGNIVKRDQWNLDNKDRFDALIALTESHKKDLIKDFGGDNFYDILNFSNIKQLKSKIKHEPYRIGFFGQLFDRKGVKDAIKALSLLHSKYKLPARLEVFGARSTPEETQKIISGYMEFAKERDLEDYVVFHGYTNNVAEEMTACHVVLFPSYTEAQGLTILEAMHLGVPVIAYDCKYGPSVMIDNNENGYLCELGNVSELAENTNKLLTNDIMREKMSKSAKEKSKLISDSKNIFGKWQEVFNDLF